MGQRTVVLRQRHGVVAIDPLAAPFATRNAISIEGGRTRGGIACASSVNAIARRVGRPELTDRAAGDRAENGTGSVSPSSRHEPVTKKGRGAERPRLLSQHGAQPDDQCHKG
jgi:hypothetical protein